MRPASDNFKLKRIERLSVFSDKKMMSYPILVVVGGLLLWATFSQAPHTLHVIALTFTSGVPLWRSNGPIAFLLIVVLLIQLLVWPILWVGYGLVTFRLLRQKPAQLKKQNHTPIPFASWHRERPLVDTDKLAASLHNRKDKQAEPVLAAILSTATPSQEEAEIAREIITGKTPALPSKEPSKLFQTFATTPSLPSSHPSGFSGVFSPLTPTQQQLHLRVGTCTSAGSVNGMQEQQNTDSLVAIQGTRAYSSQVLPFGLFMIADGKSVAKNGPEASRLVVQSVQETILPLLVGSNSMDDTILIERMGNGVRQANRILYQHNLQKGTSMRATLVAGLVIGTRAFIINIGDNRVYHYSKDKGLAQISRDHSIVARLVGAKMITPDEVYTHPDRHLIYRNLGEFARVDEIDSSIVSLQAEDSLLFCSDGLWKTMRDADIARTIENELARPTRISSLLVQSAMESKEKESASVVMLSLTN